jgi:uncharacterized cupredoxin-like copper-binding protein
MDGDRISGRNVDPLADTPGNAHRWQSENLKHGEQMQKNPDMEHDDRNAKRLVPKKTGEIVWKFSPFWAGHRAKQAKAR